MATLLGLPALEVQCPAPAVPKLSAARRCNKVGFTMKALAPAIINAHKMPYIRDMADGTSIADTGLLLHVLALVKPLQHGNLRRRGSIDLVTRVSTGCKTRGPSRFSPLIFRPLGGTTHVVRHSVSHRIECNSMIPSARTTEASVRRTAYGNCRGRTKIHLPRNW